MMKFIVASGPVIIENGKLLAVKDNNIGYEIGNLRRSKKGWKCFS